MFVVRHAERAPYLIAQHVAPRIHVINAGDGRHAHPTQGLLDMYTIRHYKKRLLQPVAIVGDVRALARGPLRHPCADHAGRARGACRPQDAGARRPGRWGAGVPPWTRASATADVIIMLRLQNERMSGAMLPSATSSSMNYGLTPEAAAWPSPTRSSCTRPDQPRRRDRSSVADGAQSVILPQVTFGIAVRMAVMSIIAGNEA